MRVIDALAGETLARLAAAEHQAAHIVQEAERRAHATFTEAENRATKVLLDAEDRMSQLKVERVAVARYFESLGEVVTNARKLESATESANERSASQLPASTDRPGTGE